MNPLVFVKANKPTRFCHSEKTHSPSVTYGASSLPEGAFQFCHNARDDNFE